MGGGRDAKNGETLESGSQEVICQAEKYQHSGAKGTRSPPATPYHLQGSNLRLLDPPINFC